MQDNGTSANIKKHLPADYTDFADVSAHCLNQDLHDYGTSANIKKHLPADYADFADASAHCLNQDLQDFRICRIMVHDKNTKKCHAGSIFLDNKPILPADYADKRRFSAHCFEQDYWILGFAGLWYKCQHQTTFARR